MRFLKHGTNYVSTAKAVNTNIAYPHESLLNICFIAEKNIPVLSIETKH